MQENLRQADVDFELHRSYLRHMLENALTRMKKELVDAIRTGIVKSRGNNEYNVTVDLHNLDVRSVEKKSNIRTYFESKYATTHGIPVNVLRAELAEHVQTELSGIRILDLQTENMHHIYRIPMRKLLCTTEGLFCTFICCFLPLTASDCRLRKSGFVDCKLHVTFEKISK